MTTLESLLQEKILLLDGGLGTQIFLRKPTMEDYGGAALEGCVDLLTERRPQWLKEIHESYYKAGSDAWRPTPLAPIPWCWAISDCPTRPTR